MIAYSVKSIQAPGGGSVGYHPGLNFMLLTMITVTAGTIFVMWIGEQITERGIGNGISLIIMAGIVARLPGALGTTAQFVREGEMSIFTLILILIVAVGVTGGIVYVETGQRRIPIQYARRVVGRRVSGGPSTHLPPLSQTSPPLAPPFFSSTSCFSPRSPAPF